MTRNEWFEIGALAVGALAVYLMLSRGGSPSQQVVEAAAQEPDFQPGYLTYNYPRDAGANSSLDLPTVASPASGGTAAAPSCGCSTGTQASFATPSALSDYLETQLGGLADSYSSEVLSSMPDFFSQMVNNPIGEQQFQQSVDAFGNVAGGGADAGAWARRGNQGGGTF